MNHSNSIMYILSSLNSVDELSVCDEIDHDDDRFNLKFKSRKLNNICEVDIIIVDNKLTVCFTYFVKNDEDYSQFSIEYNDESDLQKIKDIYRDIVNLCS